MTTAGQWAQLVWIVLGSTGWAAQAGDPAVLAQQARTALASHQYDRAAALYRDLCRLLPSEPGMRLNLGIALYSGARYSEAIAELESLLK